MQSPKEELQAFIQETKDHIADANIDEAFDGLLEVTQLGDPENYTLVLNLKARWNKLNRDIQMGLIHREEEDRLFNQIVSALLEVTNSIVLDFDQIYLASIQTLISNREIEEALDGLVSFTENSENSIARKYYSESASLRERYRELKRDGLTEGDSPENNRIINQLLDILDQIEQNVADGPTRKETTFQQELYTDDPEANIPAPPVISTDDLAARIAAILEEPVVDLFANQRKVEVLFDNLFHAIDFDVVIIPQDPNGFVNQDIIRGLERWGFEFSSKKQPLGAYELLGPFTSTNDGLQYLVAATSVGAKENTSTTDAIEQLGAAIGNLSQNTDDRRRFISPLLGSGWGGLDPVAAYEALEKGFLDNADDNAILTIYMIDQGAFEKVNKFIRDRLFAPKEPIVSSYSPDTSKGEDQLEIMHEVQAFANLMASADLQPPLSIGLFGDWGTGKSFFMEKLHDRVEFISHEARSAGGKTGIHGRIAQIKFNAWYYVDSNLWASMVTRIFDNLASFLGIKSGEEERESNLYENLASTQEQVQVAEQAQLAIKNEITTLEEELNSLKEERQRKRKELEGVRLKHLAKTVQQDEQVKGLMEKAQKELGFQKIESIGEEVNQSKAHIQGLVDRYSTTQGRLVQVYRHIVRLGNPKVYLYLFVLIVIPLGAYFLLDTLPDKWKTDSWINILTRVGSVVASLGVVIRQVIDEADPILQKVNMGIDYLNQAENRLDQLRDVASATVDEEIAALEQEYGQLNEQYQTAQNQKWEAEKQLKLVKKEIEDIKSGKRLESYIQSRVRSSDYQKHLGLISLIREDFDRLSQYLEKNPSETAVKETFSEIEKQDQLDRIILYIDDLDRCPPDRVVEVLQAIHLILAFKLFVVVVGVDVRWVSRSLLHRYGNMLTTQDKSLTDDPELKLEIRESATPFDYLEKIFQIPFRLKGMSDSTKKKYVRALMQNDLTQMVAETEEEQHDTSETETEEQKVEGNETSVEAAVEEMDIPAEAEEADTSIDLPESTVEEDPSLQQQQVPAKSRETTEEKVVRKFEEVQSWDKVKLTQIEVDFIAALTPLAGDSPRTLKRFVNVARLIKSNPNWLPPAEDIKNTKPYMASLLMLAVVVGSPWMTPLVFALMKEEKGKGLTLGKLVKTKELKIGAEIDKHRYINREWDRFRDFMDTVENNRNADIQAIPYMDIDYLDEQIRPIVSRFSFRGSNELRTSIDLGSEVE